MKKIVASMVAIVLVACIITLCGCETTISFEENTTLSGSLLTTYESPTLVVEVTDEEGSVISTETVTMSPQDKEEEKNFFVPPVQSTVSNTVSQDRLQQALQNQQALQTPATTKPGNQNTAPDINDNPSQKPSQSTTNAPADVPYIQDDAAVLRSNQYMMNVRLVDSQGVAQNYKIAKNGKKSSVSMVYNDIPLAVILDEEVWYLLSMNEKTYVEITKEQLQESATDEEFAQMIAGDPFDFNREIVSKTTVKEDGITYDVVEYDNGNKDYFVGKTIIKTTAEDNSVMYYDNVSPIAPQTLFTPPADFKKAESGEATVASVDDDTETPVADTDAPVEENEQQ